MKLSSVLTMASLALNGCAGAADTVSPSDTNQCEPVMRFNDAVDAEQYCLRRPDATLWCSGSDATINSIQERIRCSVVAVKQVLDDVYRRGAVCVNRPKSLQCEI